MPYVLVLPTILNPMMDPNTIKEGFVVTEAGFGADIGMEKFFNIKVKKNKSRLLSFTLPFWPRCILLCRVFPECILSSVPHLYF